ncbi:DUF3052 domain-containing protein [Actinomadura logoneensis]|uniref:DUF3052 domain-containing protein n=1 Tax=Actinomadura logoneensis TaxID=2293572 RepID=A0A372JLQ1_9ACTN|nr:DUF3052 domain-containing protein [Actinomadura logoneensis]RFU40941.1 DUF3052 domain-containing protein [Actinomadura logoneensis]
MSATAGQAQSEHSLAERLGFKPDQVVLEIGYDEEDADEGLRESIESVTGGELVDEDFEEVVDAVLLWWREDDGELFDALSDTLVSLADGGVVWLLTPKAGREGHVEPSDIDEAASSAGMTQSKSVSAAAEWSGTKLVPPKGR